MLNFIVLCQEWWNKDVQSITCAKYSTTDAQNTSTHVSIVYNFNHVCAIAFAIWYKLLEKRLLHPGMGYIFSDYSFLPACEIYSMWLAGFMFFLFFLSMYCMHYFFNVYFGKFVITFIDIVETGCTSIPKCNWMAIVVNLDKQTWFFLHDAACWCGFVHAGSVSGNPISSCDNHR